MTSTVVRLSAIFVGAPAVVKEKFVVWTMVSAPIVGAVPSYAVIVPT